MTAWSNTFKSTTVTLSDSDLTATATLRGSGRTETAISGKKYWEITVEALPATFSVGTGWCNSGQTFSGSTLGGSNTGVGWYSNGEVRFNGTIVDTWATFAEGDILSFCIDGTQFWYRVNGGNWNNNPAADPAAGVGGGTQNEGTIFPAYDVSGTTAPPSEAGVIAVHSGGHFLEREDGSPFFLLADTAWSLQKLTHAEADAYFDLRVSQGFTAILGPGLNALADNELGWQGGVDLNGNPPFNGGDTDSPNTAYWANIDYYVNAAETRGLMIGLVMMWGNEYPIKFGTDAAKAGRLGTFVGARYAAKTNVFWVISGEYQQGDTSPAGIAVYNAMGTALKAEDPGKLATIHPNYAVSSSDFFHNEAWLDFNMNQSSHFFRNETHSWLDTADDFALSPAKPTLDGEICYEESPINFDYQNGQGVFSAFDVRKAAYRSVFAGGMGVGYGDLYVFQFYDAGDASFWPDAMGPPQNVWQNSVNAPGAGQMQHLRSLMESRSYFNRIPDQSIMTSDGGSDPAHRVSTRASDGAYCFVYIPDGAVTTVNMNKIVSGVGARTYWFDPRLGTFTLIGDFANSGTRAFTPPSSEDWVLVLDAR